MNNNLMTFKKSKSFLDGAISLAFFSTILCLAITLLLLIGDPFYGDYHFLSFNHYSYGPLYHIYNVVGIALGIVFGIVTILHLVSFSVSCAALSKKSKEHVHASFIMQFVTLCFCIIALLIGIFFDYYKEDSHVYFVLYLLPITLIFFNIISLSLLYKHWYLGRFYPENLKKLLHERNRQTFDNYKTAYSNGLISRQDYELGIKYLKQRKDDINKNTDIDEKCISSSKRRKNVFLSLIFLILTISLTCFSLNFFERNFMTIYLDEFKQEKALHEEENRLYHEQQQEENRKQEELLQEQTRLKNEFLQKLYYHYFSNTDEIYLQIIPDTYNGSSYLKTNLPQHSYSVNYWGSYYDMQNKRFIIYREYSDGRTYDEYVVEDIYTKNDITYVKIYCFANGKTYILSSNYKAS